MKVVFVARFISAHSIHRAQIELAISLNKQVESFLLLGEFSEEIKQIFIKNSVPIKELHPKKKVDTKFIHNFKDFLSNYNPDIVHVISGKFLRNINISLKKSPIKLVTYIGSTSLYWHDFSSYFTYLSPRIDSIICNSQYVFNHVKKQLFGKAKKKAIKIYKGYNPDWFINTPVFDYTKIGIPQNAVIVAMAATHTKNKRIKDFINSSHFLTSNKEIHYVIFGHGTTDSDLNQLKEKSPIKNRIHLLGMQNDAVSLIKGANMYIQTSLNEGFGRAVSEAMCVSKPIIMTNCGGGTELIDENSGIIVPKKDTKAIANAISRLADNEEFRIDMGKKAQKRITTQFHIDNTAKDTLKLYDRLLNSY